MDMAEEGDFKMRIGSTPAPDPILATVTSDDELSDDVCMNDSGNVSVTVTTMTEFGLLSVWRASVGNYLANNIAHQDPFEGP
jgi:hypothetical protein